MNDPTAAPPDIEALLPLLQRGPVAVLTGAGLSTASGIPAYRDPLGRWQHPPPIQHQDFLRSPAVRQRYWARSFVGWPRMGQARPNPAHRALARLEERGFIHQLITQNVDGLHQQAGSSAVIELHGAVARVRCLHCDALYGRAEVQEWLRLANPALEGAAMEDVQAAPDGDAHLEGEVYARFEVPSCPACGGVLKPDVVFFGDNVPRARVAQALQAVEESAALLVAGSSLMVYSGYRFVEHAHRRGTPVAAINLGVTRADPLLSVKVEGDCGEVLQQLVQGLGG